MALPPQHSVKRARSKSKKDKSDGHYHDRITIALSVCVLVIGVFTTTALNTALAFSGCMFCLFCNPDLDMQGVTKAEGNVYRAFGKVIGVIWQTYWTPYSIVGHRSFISHTPVISTIVRYIYLIAPATLILAVLDRYGVIPMSVLDFVLWTFEYVPIVMIGTMIGDTGHFARDYFGAEF